MSHEREVVYFKKDGVYYCQHGECSWNVTVEAIEKKDVGPNILQDHAHKHRARSIKVLNSSTPVEVEIVEV